MLFIVEAIAFIPVIFYMKTIYTPAVTKEPVGFEWRYLWLIPATFYVVWYWIFYKNTSLSSLELALQPKNTLILFIINMGEVLVYHVVAKLLLEQSRSIALQEYNHQLAMQAMRYENLKEKIIEAQRAKHDVRHHIAVMQKYLDEGNYAALKVYLDQYGRSLPDDSLTQFCRNTAANTVLLYFAQQAKNEGIDYIVKTTIPQDIGISDTDISVLLGNLIENALDACKAESLSERKIIIRANMLNHSLYITVDNTFTGTLRYAPDGVFASSKHRGAGLGTQSVKRIAEQYGGMCWFEAKDGMFYASVFCTETPAS